MGGDGKKMSDKEATKEGIKSALNDIIDNAEKCDVPHTLALLAKLIFNLRFDLNELKLELLKFLKNEGDCEINHKKEEEDGKFYI